MKLKPGSSANNEWKAFLWTQFLKNTKALGFSIGVKGGVSQAVKRKVRSR
jgi:hypothetical protein